MAKTLSAAWILPAVQKALGVGEAGADAGVGGATAASAAAAAASEGTRCMHARCSPPPPPKPAHAHTQTRNNKKGTHSIHTHAHTVTLPTREPKIVQVTQGSGEGGYLVVNDSQTTIAVLLTPQARKQFERSPLVRPLAGLRNCLVKLDRWVVSYLPLAADSAGPRLAHDLDRNLAPICLQASAFSFVSGGACRRAMRRCSAWLV